MIKCIARRFGLPLPGLKELADCDELTALGDDFEESQHFGRGRPIWYLIAVLAFPLSVRVCFFLYFLSGMRSYGLFYEQAIDPSAEKPQEIHSLQF